MNVKHYNNVIDWTLKHDKAAQTDDSLATARAVFKNMGVALPNGSMQEVYDTIKTNKYMGWRACTMQEAQEAANKGTAAIGISKDAMVILSATDEEEPVTATASVMTLSENAVASAMAGMEYYAYSCGTTTELRFANDSLSVTVGWSGYNQLCGNTLSTIHWTSSDTSVATVNYYTGEITAKKAGEATITATTVDGKYTASCTVTVKIERVTIKKDGFYNNVVFETSGKVWKCVNCDTLYDEEASQNTDYGRRANYNFFTYYDEEDFLNNDTTPKEYTDDEIKLLYAIDPYGVADYVNRYAAEEFRNKNGLESNLAYKDRIFRLLFRRAPKYFARTAISGDWYEVNSYDELDDVLSESETLFGMHAIWDWHTWLEVVEALATIASIALNAIVANPAIAAYLAQKKTAQSIAKVFAFTANTIGSGFLSATTDALLGEIIEKTALSLPIEIISLFSSLNELFSDFDFSDNFYQPIMEYCITELKYDINFVFESEENCSLKDIRDALILG